MNAPYLYLAGPMRGIPAFNFPAFRSARTELRRQGRAIVCPAEMDEAEGFDPSGEALPIATYMARDLPLVCASAGVVVLPGWEASEGARLEVATARALGLPVLAYPDLEPVPTESAADEVRGTPRAVAIRRAAAEIGALTAEKNAAYGDSFAKTGEALALLYPNGIPPVAYGDALLIARLFDKLGRIANDPGAFGEDPYRDIAGYGLVATVNAAERRAAAEGEDHA